MENEAPVTPSTNLNDLSKDTPITANVEARDDSIGRGQNITGDGIEGDHIPGDQIIVDIGAGAQNVVVGSGNTQIIGYTAEQVAVIITQIRRADQPQGWNGRIPYIGLDSFGEQQAHLYFGREKLVTHLLSRVQESRFLCITGPSGSGKSSLVQAGLIPALRAGQLAGSEQWLFETVRPGNQPLENFALAIGRMAKSPLAAEYFRTHSAIDPLTLHTQMETLLSHQLNQRAVIVVDQFEEIFTQTKDEALRLTFLALLTHAVQRADGRVSVLLTMRSDFVSQCASYASLRQLISGQLELVGAMTPEELARAIAMPALEVGVEVKPALVAQVINDMQGEPGALPLLQFALKDLFDAQPKQPGRPVVLLLQEYLLRGGLHQALERHANAQFDQFLPEEQGIARQIFMRLIEVGRGTVDTRRTAVFSELVPLGVNTNQVERIVQTLANARLLTTDNPHPERGKPAAGDTRIVTIAHEKLIEAWPWLQQLVRENRTLIELQNQISADAVEWLESKRDISYLYTGARLQAVQEQLTAHQLILSTVAHQLIEASVQAETERLQQLEVERQHEARQQLEIAQQQARTDEKERARQRLIRLAWVLALLALAAISAGAIAFGQRQMALRSRNEAEIARNRAVSARETAEAAEAAAKDESARADSEAAAAKAARAEAEQLKDQIRIDQLAQTALNVSEQFPQQGLLLAVEALRLQHERRQPQISSPEQGLRDLLAQIGGTSLASLSQSVVQVAFSPNGQRVITHSPDGELNILDQQTGQVIFSVPVYDQSSTVERWLVYTTAFENNQSDVYIVDLEEAVITPRLLRHLSTKPDLVAISPDGSRLAVVVSAPGTAQRNIVQLWNQATKDEAPLILGHYQDPINVLTFSADGKWLASGSGFYGGADFSVRLWNASTPTQAPQVMNLHKAMVHALMFTADGNWLISTSEDNTILWQVNHPEEPPRILENDCCSSRTLDVSQDSRWLVVTGFEVLRLWKLDDPQARPIDLPAVRGRYMSVAFSPDGAWLASASRNESEVLGGNDQNSGTNNTVRLWPLASIESGEAPVIWHGHETLVQAVAFSPDSQSLVSGDLAGNVRLWQLANPQPSSLILYGHENYVVKTAFSPDGHYLASASWDGTIRLWRAADFTQEPIVLTIGDNSVFALAFSPDGQYLAAAGQDNLLHLWSVAHPNASPLILGGNQDGEYSVDDPVLFSADGRWLAYGNRGVTRLWPMAQLNSAPVVISDTAPALPLAFTPDGSRLAVRGADGEIRLWVTTEPKAAPVVLHLPDLHYYTQGVDISPDGRWLAAAMLDSDNDNQQIGGTVRLWQLAQPKAAPIKLYEPTDFESFYAPRFSPDGRWLAVSRASDGPEAPAPTYLWSMAAPGKPPLILPDSGGSSTFSADGQLFVTSDSDVTGSAHLWRFDSTATNPVVRSVFLRGHQARINQMAISPKSDQLATPSHDHTVRVWALSLDRLITVACQTAGRNLSHEEWQTAFPGEQYRKTCATFPVHPTVIAPYRQRAREMAEAGDLAGAVKEYQQALELEPTLAIVPEVEAKRWAVAHLLDQAAALAHNNQIREAKAALASAQTIDPEVEILAETWHKICWNGGLAGLASEVISACDMAVGLEPQNGNMRDSRGLVRTLTGNRTGAIEDFELAIKFWKADNIQENLLKQREQWLAVLKAGKNPLDETTLEQLRNY